MVGCSIGYVNKQRKHLFTSENLPDKVTGKDGKQYPTSYSKPETTEVNHEQTTTEQANPPRPEIALQEFGNLSSRAIAEMCGVNDKTVKAVKDTCGISAPENVTGQDGKTYPASKPERHYATAERSCSMARCTTKRAVSRLTLSLAAISR